MSQLTVSYTLSIIIFCRSIQIGRLLWISIIERRQFESRGLKDSIAFFSII